MALKYERIADDLRSQIRSSKLAPGDRLPTESQLSADYKVSPPTIRQALSVLRGEGLLSSKHGIGTYVRKPRQQVWRSNERHQWEKDRVQKPASERRVTGTTERDTGLVMGDLEFQAEYSTTQADERQADVFSVPVGTPLLRRVYNTTVRGESAPLGLGSSFLVLDVVRANPDLLSAENEPWPGGTQHQLFTIGIEVDRVIEELTARPPSPDEVQALDLAPGVVVIAIQKTLIDIDDRVVEWSDFVIPADRYRLKYTTKLDRW